MAKVLTDENNETHLRGAGDSTLCGQPLPSNGVTDGVLQCPKCAEIALLAVELVTKAEKRLWREL